VISLKPPFNQDNKISAPQFQHCSDSGHRRGRNEVPYLKTGQIFKPSGATGTEAEIIGFA
jgi:hypothetical protein